jgi:anhydro-N-acetylmuramic acid kinase
MKLLRVLGLMSGTSMDGIDAAIIDTDGMVADRLNLSISVGYDKKMKNKIISAVSDAATFKKPGETSQTIVGLERELTEMHADVVDRLLKQSNMTPADLDLIGFHGQTILHRPEASWTWQIGDGAMLARLTGIDVVNDFRSADVAAGGQGAPLAPLYHQALFKGKTEHPAIAVINIGGVANVTTMVFVGHDPWLKAFDTGPGNALIDDWMTKHTGAAMDKDGATAATGTVNETLLAKWLHDDYFAAPPPKSLDRNYFRLEGLGGMSVEDGAANITAFTVSSIQLAIEHMTAPPNAWYVSGGGRHNKEMMNLLRVSLQVPVEPVEAIGLDGDMMEAEAFAFLAARSKLRLPLSQPSTTGVKEPVSGGVMHKAG